MQDAHRQKLISLITQHEGSKQFAYRDVLGYLTIGIGRCIDERIGKGLSQDEQQYLLLNDLKQCESQLEKQDFYNNLDDVRKGALIELVFNMGINKFLKFVKTIESIKKGNFQEAVTNLIDSKWATQVGQHRTKDICYRLKNGLYQL